MNNKFYEYANVLLKNCINISNRSKLFISAPIESYEFVRVLNELAYKQGVQDIIIDYYDDNLKYTMLMYKKDYLNSIILDKSNWNKYALKGYSFIILKSFIPQVFNKVQKEVLNKALMFESGTQKIATSKRLNDEIKWVVAPVSTKSWADFLYKNKKDNIKYLWNKIFDMCYIRNKNSEKLLLQHFEKLNNVCHKLNKMNISSIHIKNKIGTDLIVELPKNHIWKNAMSKLNNTYVINNIPSEEVYTSPKKTKVNGVIYSTKPIFYNGKIIDGVKLKFENGKVIEYSAKKGKDALKEIINSKGGNYLGEIALVNNNSKIAKLNKIFYETLIDENASCHFALGGAYACTIKNRETKEINISNTHVDFMFGTKDLIIEAKTSDNKIYNLYKCGKINV